MREQEEPQRDRATEEADALLAADPALRESIERLMAELRAGTLGAFSDAVVRARMTELVRRYFCGLKRSSG